MDGINGITGGYALTVLIALAVACHQLAATGALPHGEALQQLIVLTGLADVVFCFFNFRRRARCFAGDVGSISIAFILLFVLCSLCVATEDLSWFAFLVVYGVDGCLTIFHRLMLHEDITTPHRKHAYQLMANELHIPHVVVSLIYMALQGAVDVVYFCFPGYLTLLLVIVVLSLAYVVFMKKYYHLHRN
jgi:UDP-N-acetylmuramyl pentapeptide phosphotransferase/UDP-N-acetylglucosamine-1-phosphate transferase